MKKHNARTLNWSSARERGAAGSASPGRPGACRRFDTSLPGLFLYSSDQGFLPGRPLAPGETFMTKHLSDIKQAARVTWRL